MRVFALFLLAYANALLTLENAIEKYINPDISPCDDYFGHICSNVKNEDDTLMTKMELEYANSVEPFKNLEAEEVATVIENMVGQLPENENKTDLIERCESSLELRLMLIEYYKKNYDYMTCEELVDRHWDNDYQIPLANNVPGYLRSIGSYSNYVKVHREEIARMESTIESLTDVIRDYYIMELQKSRWLRNFSDTAIHIMKTVKYSSTLPYDKNIDFSMFLQSFKECLKMTANDSRRVAQICLFESSRKVFGLPMMQQINTPDLSFPNAFIDFPGNYIQITPGNFVPKASDELMNTLLALLIGHELGHTIFMQIPKQPNQSECLIDNVVETCKLFNYGTHCRSGDLTYQEDAPDLVAFKALIHIQRNKPGLLSLVSSFEDLMKIYAGSYCTTDHDHPEGEEHSMGRVRVNGVLRQLTQFEYHFRCNHTSPMATVQKCFLIGQCSTKKSATERVSIFD